MGLRGPKPLPKAILKARGSRWANVCPDSPAPPPAIPPTPKGMTPEARRVWRQVTRLLDDMGVLAEIDGAKLARYCELSVMWKTTQNRAKTTPPILTYANAKGERKTKLISFVKDLLDLNAALGKIESEFGMDPSSRSRISIPTRKENRAAQEDKEFLKIG